MINVWITEEGEDETELECLLLDKRYNINFMVGSGKENSLTIDPDLRQITSDELIFPSERGSKGLETEWIVTSSTIKLESENPNISVKFMSSANHVVWLARFFLFMPIQENSETIQFIAIPNISNDLVFDVIIYARGEIFRQFEVQLDEKETTHKKKVLNVSIEC